jgi:hypothetical protein
MALVAFLLSRDVGRPGRLRSGRLGKVMLRARCCVKGPVIARNVIVVDGHLGDAEMTFYTTKNF